MACTPIIYIYILWNIPIGLYGIKWVITTQLSVCFSSTQLASRGLADRGTLSAAGTLPLARCVGSLDYFFSLEAGLKFETS